MYILASGRCGTLYIGVTSNVLKRMYEHREGLIAGFASRYGIARLVHFEQHETMIAAIAREKQMKKWRRDRKLNPIEADNPQWVDLAIGLGFGAAPAVAVMDPRLRGDDEGLG